MANTEKNRETRESRGQVARRLLQEAKRVKASVIMQESVEVVSTAQVARSISIELQDLIIEKNLVGKKFWDDVIEELEKFVLEEEEKEKCERDEGLERKDLLEEIKCEIRR
ncbi:hypothetical protein AVEN_208325-1 [Araneus ventricosus]|uniref:Uncharacterized protein n=1 Tax=Araneus ventricosus TaxID=182803 RepID=A0A4Y2NDS4_ARAVE|nr:hypothetical protein AVEN_208325-1 [Araneus ventricosus]